MCAIFLRALNGHHEAYEHVMKVIECCTSDTTVRTSHLISTCVWLVAAVAQIPVQTNGKLLVCAMLPISARLSIASGQQLILAVSCHNLLQQQ